jgi:hypothetical protein
VLFFGCAPFGATFVILSLFLLYRQGPISGFLPLVKIKCSGSLQKIILIWVVILSTGEGSGEDSSLRSE